MQLSCDSTLLCVTLKKLGSLGTRLAKTLPFCFFSAKQESEEPEWAEIYRGEGLNREAKGHKSIYSLPPLFLEGKGQSPSFIYGNAQGGGGSNCKQVRHMHLLNEAYNRLRM